MTSAMAPFSDQCRTENERSAVLGSAAMVFAHTFQRGVPSTASVMTVPSIPMRLLPLP